MHHNYHNKYDLPCTPYTDYTNLSGLRLSAKKRNCWLASITNLTSDTHDSISKKYNKVMESDCIDSQRAYRQLTISCHSAQSTMRYSTPSVPGTNSWTSQLKSHPTATVASYLPLLTSRTEIQDWIFTIHNPALSFRHPGKICEYWKWLGSASRRIQSLPTRPKDHMIAVCT